MRIKNDNIKFSQKERYDLKRAVAICEEGKRILKAKGLVKEDFLLKENPLVSAVFYLTELLSKEV